MTLCCGFVVGTRPELVKIRSVLEAAKQGCDFYLCHTGQHYDFNMNEVFFKELGIPTPDIFLGVGSNQHGVQTGEALQKLEGVLMDVRPDVVAVVGDTNTTLAGALAAIKLQIPVAHIEAGVRSFDMTMPEEINRRLVDSVATYCFAPTERAFANLQAEGRAAASYLAGDTLVETALSVSDLACSSSVLETFTLEPKSYALATLHRSENVDNPEKAKHVVDALCRLALPVVYPIHPRSRKMFQRFGLLELLMKNVRVLEPLGYLDFIHLLQNAKLVLTDSGGVQQEASIFDVPCLTLRENTEWIETMEVGKNILVGTNPNLIVATVDRLLQEQEAYAAMVEAESPFRPGASQRILSVLQDGYDNKKLRLPTSNFLEKGWPK